MNAVPGWSQESCPRVRTPLDRRTRSNRCVISDCFDDATRRLSKQSKYRGRVRVRAHMYNREASRAALCEASIERKRHSTETDQTDRRDKWPDIRAKRQRPDNAPRERRALASGVATCPFRKTATHKRASARLCSKLQLSQRADSSDRGGR